MTTEANPLECALCGGGVTLEDFCHGCNEYICDSHPNYNMPFGQHDSDLHDEDPDDDADEDPDDD